MAKVTASFELMITTCRQRRGHLRLPAFLLALFLSPLLQAQHAMHGMDSSGELSVATMPANNEVLATAPQSIMLQFESDMRLVKLVVKDSEGEFVDIGFRYRPLAGMHFMQEVPALAEADYYRVEWAVLDADGKLIKGNFHFSFGKDARPPSYYLDQMEHPQHIMSPDYRLL